MDVFSSIKQIIFEFNDDLPIGSNDYSPAKIYTANRYPAGQVSLAKGQHGQPGKP